VRSSACGINLWDEEDFPQRLKAGKKIGMPALYSQADSATDMIAMAFWC